LASVSLIYELKIAGLPSGVYIYVVEANKDGQVKGTKGKFAIVK